MNSFTRKKAPQDKNTLSQQQLDYRVGGDGKTVETQSGAFIAYCGSRAIATQVVDSLNAAKAHRSSSEDAT